ncbi:MAG: 50S ribosomal protein L32 [Balneolales bacterium]
MAHPKRKVSKSRRDKRRANHGLTSVPLAKCPNCDAVHRLHHACAECGYYRGRKVLNVTEA